jgi:hypothetical protein
VRECTRTVEKHKGCKLPMLSQCGDETCPCTRGCGRADCKTCSAQSYYVTPQRSGEAAGPSRGGEVGEAAGDRGTAGRADTRRVDAGGARPSELVRSGPILARRSGDVSAGDTDLEDEWRASLEMLEQGTAALIPTGVYRRKRLRDAYKYPVQIPPGMAAFPAARRNREHREQAATDVEGGAAAGRGAGLREAGGAGRREGGGGGVPDRSRQAPRSVKNRMGACCRIS